MNSDHFKQLHARKTSPPKWMWVVVGVGIVGIIAALKQQSIAGILSVGVIVLIVAKHAAIVGFVVGPGRIAWNRLTGRHRSGKQTGHSGGEIDVDALVDGGGAGQYSREALGAIGHRLLAEFRSRSTSVKGNDGAPNMRLVEALAHRLGQWNTGGAAKVDNPLALAGLLVSATYGLASIERETGERIMDEAVDGFAATIWSGLTPEMPS